MVKKILIIGGTNGIGLTMALELSRKKENKIIIMGRHRPSVTLGGNVLYEYFDLQSSDIALLEKYIDIDMLIISAGVGRLGRFDSFSLCEIEKIMVTNVVSIMKIITIFAKRFDSDKDFFCGIISSISGLLVSPLFAVYGASKAALSKYIEAVNIELEMRNSKNFITDIAPGHIPFTSFDGGDTDVEKLHDIADKIINMILNKRRLYIPKYKDVFEQVINKYNSNKQKFGRESFLYKLEAGRNLDRKIVKIGYLSGTFDLFHIGHLNLLKRAKEYCDYLVVGVHKDASHKGKETFIPFEERKRIVAAIDVVDKVVDSLPEDSAMWEKIQFNYLFVGSDYRGTERFNRYEKYFENKKVKIIYFPYTKSTSSTKLRSALTVLDN